MTLRRIVSPCSWLIAAAAALACSPAAAQGAASNPAAAKPAAAASAPAKPGAKNEKQAADAPDTLILSDTLNYDDVKKQSTFTGKVVMTRGLMTLRADKLVMHEDPEGFQYGTATVAPGSLVFVRQENPEKFEVVEAKGLRAEYNGKTDEFEMIGDAVVTKFVCGKPFDTISGDRVKYNQSTNTYQAFGKSGATGNNGRVRSVASPGAKAEAAAAECRQKSAKG
ncbi:lipopolysaccharide transport periplasmic protein LptA [Eoetvoesiella caeni]|uniref:lipopolysaccharide transport periplasmic protein LptA n=1 Tax=Eoetvoesiella caeni TaxID=645616 RepID=UPI0015D3BFA0|nr:lipopolysaccharide transport periplasmic protein LptA [Eoetvoesiella caeni]NYT56330.1 lipopolysaccharide transport periplasmic protein LptA [Eoetvoesiella caeni]